MNTTTPPRSPRRRRALLALAASLAVGASVVSACSYDAWAKPYDNVMEAVTERLDSLVAAGYPAALASVTQPDGSHTAVAAGLGDSATEEPASADSEVRIGSNTKMFVATVVMQLVDEGRVDLDVPVETYLPGLVTGDGIDGNDITVRALLQHTSGLPEYVDTIAEDAFAVQDNYIAPRDMLDIALERAADAAPGAQWQYSNTNYVVLGLLVERVTQRTLAEQIQEGIAAPLGLSRTYLPDAGERTIRGEHPTSYHADTNGELRSMTDMDTSYAWAAGAMVSTPSELNTFMQALVGGKLVSDEASAQMQTTVAAGDELIPDAAYGLGMQAYPLSCGGVSWGHGGDIPGTQTRNAIGPDGTAVTIAVTALPWAVIDAEDEQALLDGYRIVIDALDATLCDAVVA
nr:serine hydrolase domain-containing protein [Rhodococcus sp. 06-1059B-a]